MTIRCDLSTNNNWLAKIKKLSDFVSTLLIIVILKWIKVKIMSAIPSIMNNILNISSGIPVWYEIEGISGKLKTVFYL